MFVVGLTIAIGEAALQTGSPWASWPRSERLRGLDGRHRVGTVAGDDWGRDRSDAPDDLRCDDRWTACAAMAGEPAADGEGRGSVLTRARGSLPSTQMSNQAHPARIKRIAGTATRRAPAIRRIGSTTWVNCSPAVDTSRVAAHGVCPKKVQTSPTRPPSERMMSMRRITMHLHPAWRVVRTRHDRSSRRSTSSSSQHGWPRGRPPNQPRTGAARARRIHLPGCSR
jgi:hypothetical protein